MSTPLATLLQYRDEAVAARHALMTGGQVKEAARDGRRMAYATMTLAELNAYIAQLDREIEMAQADDAGRPRRGAIAFSYGRLQ